MASIKNKTELPDLKIYPNPFSDEFQVDNIPKGKSLILKIFDSMGRMILQNEISLENNKINLQVASGFYALQLIDKGGQIFTTEKIFKK
jgi:hypothetical protein